ncbi:ATP-binding protein [Acidovorax radicis]|uniref:ATP-binding protein n=1 Tax=Acidovorax radicis TaxID=758826 RepID=UPI001112C1DA|nr:ATP-binding protein [Acidovorax radicis]
MRKLSTKQKDRQLRLRRYTLYRAAKERKAIQRRMRKGRKTTNRPWRARLFQVKPPNHLIFAQSPETQSIFRRFTQVISGHLLDGHKVRIDFSDVELLHPCGVLLLLSHVRTWVMSYPEQLSAAYPHDDVVEQMLQSVGMLERLGLNPRKKVDSDDVTRWYFFKGETADASVMVPFMEAAKSKLGEVDQMRLYDSIAEAITNVTHHAYDDEVAKRWWMFASFSDDRVFVSILDAGRSIPGTLLEKPGVRDQIRKWTWGKKKVDARMLHAAMGGKSRTRLSYRGKGLPEMLESTKRMAGSSLTIFSRKGVFHCDSGKDREERASLPTPMEGTLLLWSLKTAKD